MSEFSKLLFYTFFAYLTSPFFIWETKRRGKDYQAGDHPNILVVPVLRHVGDLVVATPVFRAIKIHYPKSRLTVITTHNVMGLITHNPHIDSIININSQPFKNLIGRGRLFRLIWKEKFDYVISLPPHPLHNLIAFYSCAPHRVKTVREKKSLFEHATDFFNNHKVVYHDHTSVPKHYLALLRFLDIKNPPKEYEVFFSGSAEQRVKKFLSDHGISDGDLLVGISITAGNKIKEWGDEKFEEIGRRIMGAYGGQINFIGAKNDEARIESIVNRVNNRGFLKVTEFSLEDLPAFMRRLHLYIAADTGPIYIAHALKVPLIDIVGPVDPSEQPSEDERSIVVKPPNDISPSSFVFKRPGPHESQKRAVESITIEAVMNAVDILMERIGRKKQMQTE